MVDQTVARARLDAAGVRTHPLWIAPPWVLEAIGTPHLEASQLVERVAAAGSRSLLLVTKQCEGRCIWRSRQDVLRSGSEDLLETVCGAAPAAGIQIYAYYSVALDSYQVELHPDWAFVDRDGHGCYDVGFTWACLNSPYGEFVLTQLEELLRDYPVDALWLDMLAIGPPDRDCFCLWCQRRFAQTHAGQLVEVLGTQQAGVWKVECLEDFLSQTRALRDRLRPSALIAFNGAGAGFRRHPEAGLAGKRLFDYVDFLSDEGHEPHYESAICKAMRAHAKPFEVLTSNAIANEWVGWVTKPPSLLSLEGAIVGSHGGSFGLGLSILPDGEMPNGELGLVRETTTFLHQREAWFGPQTGLADVRILIQPFRPSQPFVPPEQPALGPRLPRGGGSHHVPPLVDYAPIANGLWDALREGHVACDFVHEDRELGGSGDVLVLQSTARLTDALCQRIRDFVASGGCLLAEGHASLLDEHGQRRSDFGLADVLGVHFAGYAGAWDANYLALDSAVPALARGLPEYPLLVSGPAVRVTLDGAQPLAHLVPPLGGEQTLERHTASLFNPPGPASIEPALAQHVFGQGRAIYLSVALGEYLQARRNVDPWAKQLACNLIAQLLPEPLLRTDAPPGVELVLNRSSDGLLLLHVLNNYVFGEHVSAHDPPRLAEIRVWLNERRLGRFERAWVAPPQRPLAITRDQPGWASISIPPFTIHQVVILQPA